MSWPHKLTDKMADVLRFVIRGTFIFGGIAMALALTYILIKLCWYLIRWLDHTLFLHNWY